MSGYAMRLVLYQARHVFCERMSHCSCRSLVPVAERTSPTSVGTAARHVIGCVSPGRQVRVASLETSTSRAAAVVGAGKQSPFKCHRLGA